MAHKNPRKEANKPPPVCKAILLCDAVEREKRTYKTNVKGVFDTLLVASFPYSSPPCVIYLKLVDVNGKYTIKAEILDLDEGTVAFTSPKAEIGTPGKRTQGEFHLRVSPLLFTHPGIYDVVVFADQDEIDRVQLKVRSLEDLAHAKGQEE